MRNAGLEEAQAGVEIAGTNINDLRYADDTTLVAESEEKLKSLLMKVKMESEKNWLKSQHLENDCSIKQEMKSPNRHFSYSDLLSGRTELGQGLLNRAEC